ncbi:MAG TPA: nuclear transport factor 2 family protein [Terriglobales bacterium]|nr:nuclear transport factor 2 family protein [Terriglobales bacterium]
MSKSFLCVFLFVIALVATSPANNQPEPPKSDKAPAADAANASLTQLLLEQEKALPAAEKRKDLEFFKNITTDDFLEVAPDAKVYTKDEMMEGLNEVQLENYSIYDAKVIPLNDHAAVVTYDAIVQMVVGDERAPRYQHISSVWVSQGGKWLLKFQQATAAQ